MAQFVEEHDESDGKQKCGKADPEPGEKSAQQRSHQASLGRLSCRLPGEFTRFRAGSGIEFQHIVQGSRGIPIARYVKCAQRLLNNLGNSKECYLTVKKLFHGDFVRRVQDGWRISSGFEAFAGKAETWETNVIGRFEGHLSQICNIQCTRW